MCIRDSSKVLPLALLLKVNDAVALLLSTGGALVRVVSGGCGRAIVQVCSAGVASLLPAPSMARTLKVWSPSLRPL